MRQITALLVAIVTLTACGGGSEVDLVTQVSGAGSTTLETDSARTSFTSETLGQEVSFEGVFDFAAQRAELTADAGAMGLGSGETTFLYDFSDRVLMYIGLPDQATTQIGASWLEVDLVAVMTEAGVDADLAEIIQAQSSDPTSGLQFLRGASSVTEVGTEEVRGTPTRHLEVVVDLAQLVEETPEPARDEMAELVELYTVDSLPLEVWLDDDERVRRYRQEIDFSTFELPGDVDLGPMAGQTSTIVAEYHDFGIEVDVELPRPADTITFEDFRAIAGG